MPILGRLRGILPADVGSADARAVLLALPAQAVTPSVPAMLRMNASPHRHRRLSSRRLLRALPLAWGGALALTLLALPAPEPGGAASGRARAAVPAVEVLAAGDLRGEIHPCGCSPELQWGGLPRRLTFLQQAQEAAAGNPPIVVDLGNNFPEPTDQGRLKIDLIQDLLKQYPPAAILPGPNELAVGLDALDRGLPYLVSNDAVGKAFLPEVTVERQGVRIGIYGFLSPEEVYQEFAGQYRLRPVDAVWMTHVRDRIRATGQARAILLFRGSDAELEALRRAGMFDLIIAGNPFADELNQVVRRVVAGAVMAQVPTKGQGFHRLPLRLDSAAETPLSEPIWLKETYADHPVATHALAIYDDKVKGLFFARLEAMDRNRAESPFAGAAACAACHVKSSEIWKASRHGHALDTLARVKKQFDPECLQCHVVGLGRNGFLSQDLTPQLGQVQCENCHGPAKVHAADPQHVRTSAIPAGNAEEGGAPSVCRICHHGSHSPSFSFATYWPKIAHGKD